MMGKTNELSQGLHKFIVVKHTDGIGYYKGSSEDWWRLDQNHTWEIYATSFSKQMASQAITNKGFYTKY